MHTTSTGCIHTESLIQSPLGTASRTKGFFKQGKRSRAAPNLATLLHPLRAVSRQRRTPPAHTRLPTHLPRPPGSDHARRPRQRRWLPGRGVGGQQSAGQAQQGRGAWPFGREAADAARAAAAASDGAAWRPLVDARDAPVHGPRGGVVHASLPRRACRGGRRGAVSGVVFEPRAGPRAPGRGGVFVTRWCLAGGREAERRME